jgi:hypothetical protein
MKKLLLSLAAVITSGLSYGQSIDSVTVPSVIQMGTTIQVGFVYTSSAAPSSFQVQIFKQNGSGEPNYASGSSVVNGGYTPLSEAPGGNGFSGVLTFDIPAVDSSPEISRFVPGGTNDYVWFIKMTVNGTDYYYNPKPLISFTAATLATQNFSAIGGSEMYVSNASKSLVVNQSNLKSESAAVYDVTGRAVTTIKNLKQTTSHDLSSLRKGVYFIVTNDKRKLKFAL